MAVLETGGRGREPGTCRQITVPKQDQVATIFRNSHACIHTYTYTHIHIYIYIYIYINYEQRMCIE